MDYIYILIVVVAIIGLSYIVYPYLKSKNIINDDSAKITIRLINIVESIYDKYSKDAVFKSKVKFISDISIDVVSSVETIAKSNDSTVKKQLAMDSVEKIMTKLGVPPSQNDKELIDFSIETAVKSLPVSNKNG